MKAQNFLKYFILLVVGANLAIVAAVLLSGLAPKAVPMPSPNGYDDFVKAGQILVESAMAEDYKSLSKEDLKALVAKNASALELGRTGLSRQCRVPDEYSTTYLHRYRVADLSFDSLVMAFCAQGRLAELEGRTNDAARTYLDGLRIGQESRRGGDVASRLMGIASEQNALSRLEVLTNGVTAPECREVIQALEVLDAKEEPAQETLKQDRAWARKATGWQEQVGRLFYHETVHQLESDFIKTHHSNALRRRRLMVAFADRAYALEKGKPPQTLADLVPTYLKAIPQDPFTGTNLVYQP